MEGIGAFPERGQPAVFWLRASAGAAELDALALLVQAALRSRGVPFDGKPFRPHVTLARVRRDAPATAVAAAAVALSATGAGGASAIHFRADALHVVESILSPAGPRYSSLQVVPLASSPLLRPPSQDRRG